ncbi:hypothetical protein F5Y19DRAFT_301074 [Xylariaceae sp. FL1651]|nr:hypothetical protein F5Y19DRAFT_301074 [Xylariaceae sp. FL1651]
MSTLYSWFSPGSSKSKSPGASALTSTSFQHTNKVLHGRVTKPVSAKATPSASTAKHQAFVEDGEDDEEEQEDVASEMVTDMTGLTEQMDESGDEDNCIDEQEEEEGSERIKDTESDDDESIYESDGEEDEDGDGDEDHKDSAHGMHLAMMAHPVGLPPQNLPGVDLEVFKRGFDEIMITEKARAAQHAQTALTHSGPAHQQNDSDDSMEVDANSETDSDTAWRPEQLYLNTILNARNQFTLMPSTWRMHFRGIPLPDSLFYFKTKSKSVRPRIYARTDKYEYRGAVALRKLIDVHARIQDLRAEQTTIRQNHEEDPSKQKSLVRAIAFDIVKQLRRALEHALNWAQTDGDITKFGDKLPPNTKIIEIKDKEMADAPDSEAKIQTEMCDLATKWRDYAVMANESKQPPVIFGFVILRHIVFIVTIDASDPDAIIHIPCQLNMAERNQHQWNALAIMVTVCWARDVLLDYIEALPDLQPVSEGTSSDPDA